MFKSNHRLTSRQLRFLTVFGVLGIALALLLAANLPGLTVGAAAVPQGNIGQQSAAAAFQQQLGCVEGHKIDDLHVGLPGWTVHARPSGAASPTYTKVTDGTGYFRFDDLPVGTYTFWEEMQTGWAPVTSPQFDADVLAGPDCTYIRFKNKQATPTPTPTPTQGPPAVRMRGYVYQQTCGGPVILPGVTLDLWKSNLPNSLDTKVETTASQPSGFWNFYQLPPPPPYYHVLVVPPAGLVPYSASAPEGVVVDAGHIRFDNPTLMVYGDNTFTLIDPNLDCDTPPAAIGDYVWYDADHDGLQDVTEPGIGNVKVNLWRDNGNGSLDGADSFIATTNTDADGGYIFKGLAPGTYLVEVVDATVPAGYVLTIGPQSETNPTGPITVVGGETYRDADFGYYHPSVPGTAVVGDTVWWDPNQDGVRDPGEQGIAGAIVNLYSVGPDGVPGGGDDVLAGTDTTDVNGNYLIINVAPGTYYASVSNPPAGASSSAGAPNPTATFSVASGDQYLDADIGFVSPDNSGTIGGTLWYDFNQNGLLDPAEPLLPGVSVSLVKDTNNNGVIDPGEPIIATNTTDANGDYSFVGLAFGRYLTIVTDTQNALADYAKGPLGPNPGVDNNSQTQPYAITLPPGGSNTTGDFGYIKPNPDLGKIGNQVWVESDRDGVFEPQDGEPGVAGVTVELFRSNILYGETTTGASGDYIFSGLPAGNYKAVVTDKYGILGGYQPTKLGTPGVDFNNQIQPYPIVLPLGVENMTADFGYTRAPNVGCVEGYKIDDLHFGLPDWEIHAHPRDAATPEYITTTDGIGYFRFDELTVGWWTFSEVMQSGWEPVTSPEFDVYVQPGPDCTGPVRFKNRQTTPTPTVTPTVPTPTQTPTVTPTATPSVFKLYFPMYMRRPERCVVAQLQVDIWGKTYSFPLKSDGNVKTVPPLVWFEPTVFKLVNYDGPVSWTQYQPYYNKQYGGYTYTFPGGYSGEEFSLWATTNCGYLRIETDVDDPTPTPIPGVTPTPRPTIAPSWVTVLSDNFAQPFPGRWETQGDPTWYTTSCRINSGQKSVWPAAAGQYAQDPCAENYPNNTESWLVYGPFDLRQASAAEVNFSYWLKSELNYDFFEWMASTDGANFYGLRQSGNTGGWTNRTFDLSNVQSLGDLRGKQNVWLAFVFSSDKQVNDQGVFIDNITIRKYVGGAPPIRSGIVEAMAATDLAMEPTSRSR